MLLISCVILLLVACRGVRADMFTWQWDASAVAYPYGIDPNGSSLIVTIGVPENSNMTCMLCNGGVYAIPRGSVYACATTRTIEWWGTTFVMCKSTIMYPGSARGSLSILR